MPIPRFIIEDNVSPVHRTTLEDIYSAFCTDPAQQLTDLKTFAENPSESEEDSMWRRLTEYGASSDSLVPDLIFDNRTMRYIERDELHAKLYRARGGDSFANGRAMRIRRFTLFLDLLVKAQAAGQLSLRNVA